jgi:hypothetical protein
VAAVLLAALIGGGIYAVRRSGTTAPPPSPAPTQTQTQTPPHTHAQTPASAANSPVAANDPRPASTSHPRSEASKSPKQILADAASALRSATGFEFEATQSEGGKTTLVHVLVSPHSLAFGASSGAAAYEVLKVPAGVYVRGNAGFWKQHLGARGAVLADRWIHRPGAALPPELTQVRPDAMARCLTEDNGKLSTAGTTSVNGRPAIVIRDAGNLPGTIAGTLAVATTGPPYPLRETVAGRQRAGGHIDKCNDGHASGYQTGTVTFSHFDQVPPLQAPAEALQIPGPPLS